MDQHYILYSRSSQKGGSSQRNAVLLSLYEYFTMEAAFIYLMEPETVKCGPLT